MCYISARGQAWFADLMISLFAFGLLALLFYRNLDNLLPYDELSYHEVRGEAVSVARTLLSTGTPSNWSLENVNRLGLLDATGSPRIISRKLLLAQILNVTSLRGLLPIVNSFLIYFENSSGVINYGGICSIGESQWLQSNNSIAYYSKNATGFFGENMATIGAAMFNYNTIGTFFSGLGSKSLIVLENPEFQDEGGISFSEKKARLENAVASGSVVAIIGNPGGNMLNASFSLITGENGTCIKALPMLGLGGGEQLLINFTTSIASLSSRDPTIYAVSMENHTLIAEWEYGQGRVIYLANPTLSLEGRGLEYEVFNWLRYYAKGTCTEFNPEEVGARHMASIKRLVMLDSSPVWMVVTVWD